MVRFLLLLFLFPLMLPLNGQDDLLRGYLITLDGKRLLGHIGPINHIRDDFYLYFENDFGTDYNIPPQLIKGFLFKQDSTNFIFESYYHNGRWTYLQLIYPGDEILLYQTPNIQVNWVQFEGQARPIIPKHKHLWIKAKHHKITRIKRLNYKRKLKKIFRKVDPELAKKIGKPGYRFKDIFDILRAYNLRKKKVKSKVWI